jgi:hypothetical protein
MISGDSHDPQAPLDNIRPLPTLNTVVVNSRVTIREDPETGLRTVFVGGVPFFVLHRGDEQSVRYVCVQLRLQGLAEQLELAAAFGHDRTTQYRWEKRFEKDGLEGLLPYRPKGRTPSIPKSIEATVVRLHGEEMGMRRIASRLGLSLGVVRGVYERHGLEAHRRGQQQNLFETVTEEEGQEPTPSQREEQEAASYPRVVEEQPVTSRWDGLLWPEYSTEQGAAFAGVLLALPLLGRFRVIEILKAIYKRLSALPVYGLETLVTLMVFMALWRIKRPEQLKSYPPVDLGKALGMPRAPEVKTVRRKLDILAGKKRAAEAMVELAKVWLVQEDDLLGFLYVDGHVRVYGGQHDLAKGYSMRRHMPARATTDVWANDRRGDPLFVVTSEINEPLTQMLKPVLKQARELVNDDRSITVIFDRGGWSPQLFVELIESGSHILTYRKGRTPELPGEAFETRTLEVEGRKVEYQLCDEPKVRVGAGKLAWSEGPPRPLFLRQVTKLTDTGHQTQVLTSRQDLAAAEVLWRMFNRWRQENFFKYMRQEFAIDALVEYGALGVDPELERPNPERLAAHDEIKALRRKIEKLQGKRCEMVGDPYASQDAPHGFERFVPSKPKEQALRDQIKDLKLQLQELEALREELPERVSAGDLERLKPERKLLSDLFKIVAYHIESELVRLVAPHYARTEDEGHKLIATALSSAADLEVTDHELRVTLAPQSSPHRSRAIDALCASLNNLPSIVPGTDLQLVLSCRQNAPADVAREG